jgi:hypothetical protein
VACPQRSACDLSRCPLLRPLQEDEQTSHIRSENDANDPLRSWKHDFLPSRPSDRVNARLSPVLYSARCKT